MTTCCESLNRVPDQIILKEWNNGIYWLQKEGLNFGYDLIHKTNSVSNPLGVIFLPSILNCTNLTFDSYLVFHLGFVGIFFSQLGNMFAVYLC